MTFAVALASSAPAPAAPPRAAIAFDGSARDRLVITAPAYRLALSKRNGAIVELKHRPTGARLLRGSIGCLWGAVGAASYVGGCSFAPSGAERFSYRWNRASRTLTLAYDSDDETVSARAEASVTLHARPSSIDLRLALANETGRTLTSAHFPADLLGDALEVDAGYAPTYLPGVRLERSFFSRVGQSVRTYPSRWAFADYLALDVAGAHVALSSVNPAPSPLQPVELGFVRNAAPAPCSGRFFCVTHVFQTWIRDGTTWTSPVVRLRVGGDAEETILAYRRDNGIDGYRDLAAKVGGRLEAVMRAPLLKADQPKGLRPFREWRLDLREVPVATLLHPVAFQPGGHDERSPDSLPPDTRWGTSADLRAMVADAHSLGHLVMPYLNPSWWNSGSPTLSSLPPPLTVEDLAVLDARGQPVVESYGERRGYVVSPHVPFVRDRVARLMEEWRSEVPADCLFFDQLGARPWRRDFNSAAPSPLAYYDGWLTVLAPYADRCLMVEDGWDRLADSFAGFHGGLLELAREHDEPDEIWGAGNWEPYPLALWLLHDKVLLYQHDLFPGTMTADDEVLSWNVAFGLLHSASWDDALRSSDSRWLELAGTFQRALAPHYAGRRLTGYRDTPDGVVESTFERLVVVANRRRAGSHETDGYRIPPNGFLARTDDDGVLAGIFTESFNGVPLTPGNHYVLVERTDTAVTVRQPLGADSILALDPPRSWRSGRPLRTVALARDGHSLGEVEGAVREGRFELAYAATRNGRRVDAYRISAD